MKCLLNRKQITIPVLVIVLFHNFFEGPFCFFAFCWNVCTVTTSLAHIWLTCLLFDCAIFWVQMFEREFTMVASIKHKFWKIKYQHRRTKLKKMRIKCWCIECCRQFHEGDNITKNCTRHSVCSNDECM